MTEPNQTEALLAEIRDLIANGDKQYKQHLADSKRLYEEQLAAHQQRTILHRPLQWLSLFLVVYAAVYCALQSVN
jgi:hypothetical protein